MGGVCRVEPVSSLKKTRHSSHPVPHETLQGAAAHHHLCPLLLTQQSCFLPPQEPGQVDTSRLPHFVLLPCLIFAQWSLEHMLCFCGAVTGSQETSDHVRWHLGGPCSCNWSEAALGHDYCWLCLCRAARKLPESQGLMQQQKPSLRWVFAACHIRSNSETTDLLEGRADR